MSSPTASDWIAQAAAALQNGQRGLAQQFLAQVLQREPQNLRAWLMMAAAVDQPERRRYCLERALAIEPGNPQALQALHALEDGTLFPGAETSGNAAPIDDAPHPPKPPESGESPHQTALSVSDDPAPQPTLHPKKAKRARSCVVGLGFLVLLAFAAWIFIAGFPLMGNSASSLPWIGALDFPGLMSLLAPPGSPQDPPRPQAPAGPLPTLGLLRAPTWTPTPSPLPGEPTAPRPTLDLYRPSGPVASITPFWGEWKLVIGRSAQGRPLEVYRFGSGKKERMIIAGIHGGDEWNTIALADELIAYVRRRPGLVPPGYSLFILRALNPDGEARGHNPNGRLNANGVDLNRNFDTNWKSTWRSTGCSSAPGTGGSGPGSEPETQAVKAFLLERNVEALINYHSAGLGVFPSGDPSHPGSVRLAESIASISDYVYPPIKTGCEYTGTLVDWAADHGVVAAVDLELNSLKDTEFDANRKILELLMTFDVQRPTATPTP